MKRRVRYLSHKFGNKLVVLFIEQSKTTDQENHEILKWRTLLLVIQATYMQTADRMLHFCWRRRKLGIVLIKRDKN